jgi:predicted MFS family arabinose efflux permease
MDLPEAGSAMFVSVIQVAIAVGSAVGGTIVDRAGVHADFLLGLALALLGLAALQWLTAPQLRISEASLDCACDSSD